MLDKTHAISLDEVLARPDGQLLVFIDPTRDIESLAHAIRRLESELSLPPTYFIASKAHGQRMFADLATIGLNIDDRLMEYRTINSEYDDDLYKTARYYADLTFDIYQSSRRLGLGAVEFSVAPDLKEPFSIGVMDRFVSQMRPVLELALAAQTVKAKRILHLVRPSTYGYALHRSVISALPNVEVIASFDHIKAGPCKYHRAQSLTKVTKVPAKLLDLPVPKTPARAKAGRVVIGTNLQDHQYRMTCLPIIQTLVEYVPLLVVDARPTDVDAFVMKFDLQEAVKERRLILTRKPVEKHPKTLEEAERKLVANVARRLESAIASNAHPEFSAFAAVLADYLRTYGAAYFRYVARLDKTFNQHVMLSERVLVTPGRTTESGVLTQLARRHGVLSFEIQSGTVSRNFRYTAPQADYVLTIEAFSKGVYSEFLGHPEDRVIPVGGPKLEYDIAPMRALTRKTILERHPHLSRLSESKVLLLASQPIGLKKAEAVFRTLADGVAQCGLPLCILVKPHPNEGAGYTESYLRLAQDMDLDLVIDTKLNALEAVILSDIVSTFYSTVGLEAFALNRPVVAINPFKTPSPYDLVALGIAHDVRNRADMARLLSSWTGNTLTSPQSDPSLTNLQDGLTLDRLRELVLSQDGKLSLRFASGYRPTKLDLTKRWFRGFLTPLADALTPRDF